MRKLFETNHRLLFVEKEHEVFSWYDDSGQKRWHFVDGQGNENVYQRPPLPDEEADMEGETPDDPTHLGPIVEGMYPFTTHPVTYYPVDYYGVIGIKNAAGQIVAEEQYEQVDSYFNGWCSVKKKDGGWGCIDKAGQAVVSFSYGDPVRFNSYGVALGNGCLIDRNEKEIEGTDTNCCEQYDLDSRYFLMALLSKEQEESIERCGSAESVTFDVYDTKLRRYVARGIPDGRISIFSGEAEPWVILAAVELLREYDCVSIYKKGTILAERGGTIAVFDYYL